MTRDQSELPSHSWSPQGLTSGRFFSEKGVVIDLGPCSCLVHSNSKTLPTRRPMSRFVLCYLCPSFGASSNSSACCFSPANHRYAWITASAHCISIIVPLPLIYSCLRLARQSRPLLSPRLTVLCFPRCSPVKS